MKDAIISARIESSTLYADSNTLIIPVVTGEKSEAVQKRSKGFGPPKDELMESSYIGKPTQVVIEQLSQLSVCSHHVYSHIYLHSTQDVLSCALPTHKFRAFVDFHARDICI